MTINGTNISTFSASVIDRKMTNHNIVNVYEWLDGSSSPVFIRDYAKEKSLTLTILIKETSDDEAYIKINSLIKAIKKATLKFSDIQFYYDCFLEGSFQPEKLIDGTFKLELELICYNTYLSEVTDTDGTIVNAGNREAEMQIIIITTDAISELTISNLTDTPIKLKNMSASTTYMIDGYTYKYLKGGANDIGNYDAFEFPKLPVGTTTVSIAGGTPTISYKYKPKFY